MAEAKWEHLTCEAEKPHKWKRPIGMRGRKPRFCEKHKPVIATASKGATTLHCQIGNHDWNREPTRGRVPINCPEHKPVATITAAPRTDSGKVSLHCEIGNHKWERVPQRGRKPANCPDHSAPAPRSVPVSVVAGSESGDPVKRAPGRPKKYDTKEEQTEAQLQKSRERTELLEGALKERGTHLSQQSPYILYKKISQNKRGTVTWEKAGEHSPLAQAQWLLANAKAFEDGLYRYERNGKVVVL